MIALAAVAALATVVAVLIWKLPDTRCYGNSAECPTCKRNGGRCQYT